MSPQQAQAEAAKQAAEAQAEASKLSAPAPEPAADVIQFTEAKAQLQARVKEQKSLDAMCAELVEIRKTPAL
jgi:hypothetical protein